MSALLNERSNPTNPVPQLPVPSLDPAWLELWKAGIEWQSRVGPFGATPPIAPPVPTPLPDKEQAD
jgi:hypothetical protein